MGTCYVFNILDNIHYVSCTISFLLVRTYESHPELDPLAALAILEIAVAAAAQNTHKHSW